MLIKALSMEKGPGTSCLQGPKNAWHKSSLTPVPRPRRAAIFTQTSALIMPRGRPGQVGGAIEDIIKTGAMHRRAAAASPVSNCEPVEYGRV
jgi:hypothetical protein